MNSIPNMNIQFQTYPDETLQFHYSCCSDRSYFPLWIQSLSWKVAEAKNFKQL